MDVDVGNNTGVGKFATAVRTTLDVGVGDNAVFSKIDVAVIAGAGVNSAVETVLHPRATSTIKSTAHCIGLEIGDTIMMLQYYWF